MNASPCLAKLVVLIILTLIIFQYLYSTFEMRQTDQLYLINSSFTDRHPLFLFEKQLDNGSKNGSTVYLQKDSTKSNASLQDCPLIPPNLVGIVKMNKEVSSLEEAVGKVGRSVVAGGQWRPPTCKARNKVALIVPYRDRPQHLCVFLANIHPFLQRQQLDYRIFVIEQAGNEDFNRGMLMNVGFTEANGMSDFDCFIFHDVDLLPEDDRNLYTCPDQPRHMSAAVDVFNYRLPYSDLFGGVSALSKEHFEKVNGFSNMFWGWGAEDDDMASRIKSQGLHITRYPVSIARYTMLAHKKQKANPRRFEKLYTGLKRMKTDGLNSLKYKRLETRLSQLFTWILVELHS